MITATYCVRMGSIDIQSLPEINHLNPPQPKSSTANPTFMKADGLGDGAFYWWRTSGQDLSRMLVEADYPEECRCQFLSFCRNTICPLLGGRPEPSTKPSPTAWDGNPFEYSFELKGSTKKVGVRFALDLTEVRPERKDKPMDMTTYEKVLDVLREKSPMYDETWVCLLPTDRNLPWYHGANPQFNHKASGHGALVRLRGFSSRKAEGSRQPSWHTTTGPSRIRYKRQDIGNRAGNATSHGSTTT
jgi:hypothetical protein